MNEGGEIANRLRTLIAKGYQFAHPRDAAGEVVAITGVRVHHGVVDIVQIFGEEDVDAVRVPDDEVDILFPRTVLWRASGRAADVIESLLALPDPRPDDREGGHPRGRASGCWVPTQPGRMKWFASTA